MHRDLRLPDRLILETCPWEDMLPLTVMLPSHDPVNLSHKKGVSKRKVREKDVVFSRIIFFSPECSFSKRGGSGALSYTTL